MTLDSKKTLLKIAEEYELLIDGTLYLPSSRHKAKWGVRWIRKYVEGIE